MIDKKNKKLDLLDMTFLGNEEVCLFVSIPLILLLYLRGQWWSGCLTNHLSF